MRGRPLYIASIVVGALAFGAGLAADNWLGYCAMFTGGLGIVGGSLELAKTFRF